VSAPPLDATLLVACPDRKGLVAALAGLLYDHGANILQSQQHTEPAPSGGLFFQRIRFDTAELDIGRDELESLLQIECGRYDMRWHLSWSDRPKRVALFVSKFEHCLYDLLLRHRLGELRCDVVAVISNHPDHESAAGQFGVPYYAFPITKDTKADQEAREIALLEELHVDLVVLARYMQVLSDGFVSKFPERIINIHHGFLPAFMGRKPYHQAHEHGVKLIGATAHYATAELDEGPIISQDVVTCTHRDTPQDLVRKGRDVERVVLASAVRAHLDDRILVHGRRTVVF
jgi:formyltetrahydrofolate deformylase